MNKQLSFFIILCFLIVACFAQIAIQEDPQRAAAAKLEFQRVTETFEKRFANGEDTTDLFLKLHDINYRGINEDFAHFIFDILQKYHKKITDIKADKKERNQMLIKAVKANTSAIKTSALELYKPLYEETPSLEILLEILQIIVFSPPDFCGEEVDYYLTRLKKNYPQAEFKFNYYQGHYLFNQGNYMDAMEYLEKATNQYDGD